MPQKKIAVPEQVAILASTMMTWFAIWRRRRCRASYRNSHGAGYLAATLLAKMLAGEEVDAKAHLLEPLGIETRQSTDSLAIDDQD